MFFVAKTSAFYAVIWKLKVVWGPWKSPSPVSQLSEASEISVGVFLHFKPWHIFAAYQACKGQKIILFRSTPQLSWCSWCLCQENVYFSLPLFTCQEGTEGKKSWQSMGHPGPERESHALAQLVNITQPHRAVITFWELSRLCIIILWGGLQPCMNNTMMQW